MFDDGSWVRALGVMEEILSQCHCQSVIVSVLLLLLLLSYLAY